MVKFNCCFRFGDRTQHSRFECENFEFESENLSPSAVFECSQSQSLKPVFTPPPPVIQSNTVKLSTNILYNRNGLKTPLIVFLSNKVVSLDLIWVFFMPFSYNGVYPSKIPKWFSDFYVVAYLPVLYSTSLQVSTKASHLAQLLKLILIGVVKNETAIQAEIFSPKFVSIFDKIFEEEKFWQLWNW